MATAQALSPFARLFRSAAVAEAAAKAAADEDAKKAAAAKKAAEDDGEEDDAKKAKAKAEEDDEKKKDGDAKKKAADDDDGENDDDDDDDDDDKKKKTKAKRSKSEGDDDSDKDDEKDDKASAARARERGRIEAIMMSDAAAANPTAALHMAVHTATPRRAAIGMLTAFAPVAAPAAPAKNGNQEARKRLEAVQVPDVGADDPAPAAGKKRRGEAA